MKNPITRLFVSGLLMGLVFFAWFPELEIWRKIVGGAALFMIIDLEQRQ